MGCNSSAPFVSEEEAAEVTQMRMQMEHDMIQMSLGVPGLDTVEKVIAFQASLGNHVKHPPTWLYFWDKSVCPTWEGWWLTPSVGSDSHIVFAPGQGKNVLRAGRWYCGPGQNVEVKTFTVASRTGEQLVGVYGPGGMPGNGVYQEQPGHPHTSGIGSGRPVYKRIRPLSPDEWEACREKNGRIPPWISKATDHVRLVPTGGLTVGSKITARYMGGPVYFPGKVVSDHGNGSYDIDYDDGDQEDNVPAVLIRCVPAEVRGG